MFEEMVTNNEVKFNDLEKKYLNLDKNKVLIFRSRTQLNKWCKQEFKPTIKSRFDTKDIE